MELKKVNRNRIFRYILEREEVSMADISRDLRISLPTVTQHVGRLKDAGLLLDGGLCESTGGRRAKAIACNIRATVGCGINITHRDVDFVLVDLVGTVIDYTKLSVPCELNGDYLEMLRSTLLQMIQRSGLPAAAVLGVGISLPAIIDGGKRICDTAFDFPVPPHFQEDLRTCLPFQLDFFNDASSGGYAEFWHCKDAENLFYLSLSGSVGGAVRIHRRAYDGDDFRSAEIGHTTIVPGGRLCYCGQQGCMNAYCSSNSLSAQGGGSLETFFQRLEAGDPACAAKWDEYLGYLAIAINNIRLMYDCDVILGGSVARYIGRYVPELNRRLAQRDSFHRAGTYIRACRYDSESSAVGAALIFVDRFIDQIGA
ncbi:MAG: ROK family transcriptional regulator [Oscillospiraceae bacterium]|nr:ROK family transcriptional regulator [Oscillospiraceae bacterium]MCI8525373.1 ROK family transcriptional regulator [Oscillospiraceae bacterium]